MVDQIVKQKKESIEIGYIRAKYPKLYRFFIMLPGLLGLIIVTMTISNYSLFIFYKDFQNSSYIIITGIIILLYYVWWIIRGYEYIIFTFIATFTLFKYQKIRFDKVLGYDPNINSNLSSFTLQEKFLIKNLKGDIKPNEIIHWFLIATYKEEAYILDETFHNLFESNYDKKRIAITLAGEERDIENFKNVSSFLKDKYSDKFGYLSFTVHPKDTPGEVQGKGGNITYAAKTDYPNVLKSFDTTPDKVILTTLDADHNIDKEYPNVLTYTYLTTEDRKYKAYQPMTFFFNNFWDAPFFSKIVSLGNSFWILFNSVKSYGIRNFASHAQPLDGLIEIGFWSVETIVEDGHQYRRSYFGFDGKYECVPVFSSIYHDCNLNKDFFSTAKAQYKQMRRWSHGSEDVAYVFVQRIDNFKKLSFWRLLYEFVRLFENIVLWGTLHIMLMAGMIFSLLKDIKFSSAISLGQTVSIFINTSFVLLIIVLGLQLLFSPWYKLQSKRQKIKEICKFIFVYMWLIGPMLVIFTGVPALHTQIAQTFGRPMTKFNVTEKIRKTKFK